MHVYSIFPTPLLCSNIGRSFTEEEIEYVSFCERNSTENVSNRVSSDNHVLDKLALRDVRQYCDRMINEYVVNVLSPVYKIEPYITQSWLNFTKKNESHHKHSHNNSIVSGVLYIKTDINCGGELAFASPNKQPALKIMSKDSQYLHESVTIKPAVGSLYMFPSYLEHEVSKYLGDNDRISLAFNVFVRGKIGEETLLSGLELR